jgi:hypothetical protein
MRYPTAFTKTVSLDSKVHLLDRDRAKIVLNMFALIELTGEAEICEFVEALFQASHGNQEVKALLLQAPFEWLGPIEAAAMRDQFEAAWAALIPAASNFGAIASLRALCLRDPLPWPDGLLDSLFDDPSFDPVAYFQENLIPSDEELDSPQ